MGSLLSYTSSNLENSPNEDNVLSIDNTILEQITATYSRHEPNYIHLRLHTPEMSKRRPVAFVCVIDVSGSMAAVVGAGEGGKAFTRLDLVKHVLNVLITCLTENDSLSLITFSDETKVVLEMKSMSEENKDLAKNCVRDLKPTNGTNTGPAIQKAYSSLLGKRSISNHLKSIILLTDGEDSKGEHVVHEKFDSAIKPDQVQFSTFGFSNEIRSKLLQELAIKGGGIFGFIPDQSMIGTIFINYLANTFLTLTHQIYIEVSSNYEFNKHDRKLNVYRHNKQCLQFGKERNFLLKLNKENESNHLSLRIGFDKKSMIDVKLKEETALENEDSFNVQKAKYKMLDLVLNPSLSHSHVKIEHYANSFEIQKVKAFLYELKQEIDNADANNEQIKLALDFWDTWGAHYIRSFGFAHIHEQCLNFKSPSMKFYQTKQFNELVDKLTDLFITIPPPKPSAVVQQHSGLANQPYSHISRQAMPIINMQDIMDRNNGCILASCHVKLANDKKSKSISELRKGDILANGFKVVCLIKSKYEGPLIQIGQLTITPYHPVFIESEWKFPVDLVDANKVIERIDGVKVEVCNLVLESGHVVDVEGVKCVTLSHGFEDNDVVRHCYYGTSRVLDDLKRLNGWDRGYIVLEDFRVERNVNNGVVVSTFDHSTQNQLLSAF